MRIVIDMQGAQTGSRLRGIGRYLAALAKAMARNRGGHDLFLALNGAFPDSVDAIRRDFSALLPASAIRVWKAPGPTRWGSPGNDAREAVAERIREAAIATLRPDVVLIGSLFEGCGDEAVSGVGAFDRRTPVAAVLYDLIPLLHPDRDHESPAFQAGYRRKIAHLSRCRLLLAISEYTRREALGALPFSPDQIVNIFGACEPSFRKVERDAAETARFKAKFGLTRPFVMYAGGADRRKNLPRLIESYAALPSGLVRSHHLVLAGDMPAAHVADLRAKAASVGLSPADVLFVGHVGEEDLLTFYNACALFVFPSLLEGLGLPPMEAMACGAPVVAADAASLPEVVDDPEALFDPRRVASIRDAMARGLTDDAFRKRLAERGLERVKRFSWDESARKAFAALERFAPAPSVRAAPGRVAAIRSGLFAKRSPSILVLKLDHVGDFVLALPALAKLRSRYPYADIDIAVGSWNRHLAERSGLFRSVFTFDCMARNAEEQAGRRPADVDAFLAGLGRYDMALDLRRQPDTRFVLAGVRAGLKAGYASFDARVDACLDILLPAHPDVPFAATPMNRTHIGKQMLAVVDALPESSDDFVVLPETAARRTRAVGAVAVFPCAGNGVREWGAHKYRELIERLEGDAGVERINVFFATAGERERSGVRAGGKVAIHVGLGQPALLEALAENAVCVANNSGGAHLAGYLGLATVAIFGGQETVAEWLPPFGDGVVLHRNAFCSPCHCASRAACPHDMFCLEDIPVGTVHEAVANLLAGAAKSGGREEEPCPAGEEDVEAIVDRLVDSIARIGQVPEEALPGISACIALSVVRPEEYRRRLFVDISELERNDAGTGIQRVAKNILAHAWRLLPEGWDMVPVHHRSGERGFRPAVAFVRRRFGHGVRGVEGDGFVEGRAGDVFLGLDLNLSAVDEYGEILAAMRRAGVRVEFVVYDLLCVAMPRHFERELALRFPRWLAMIAKGDGALCISKATAGELAKWMAEHAPRRHSDFRIRHFHLGADFAPPPPDGAPARESLPLPGGIGRRPSFLVVGTLEPRKGHRQLLAAFRALWAAGQDLNLVLVGKKGWLMDDVAEAVERDPEAGRRLFWLRDADDRLLDTLYAASDCLVAASEGEGFGLFLVEAARRGLPVIARDLEVFREVAGDHAHYFEGDAPEALADAILAWLELRRLKKHPRSDGMPWLTWRQSAAAMLELLLPSAPDPETIRPAPLSREAGNGDGVPSPEDAAGKNRKREMVLWCYRLLLEREPENDLVLDREFASVRELRDSFLDSEEFRQANAARFAAGRGDA